MVQGGTLVGYVGETGTMANITRARNNDHVHVMAYNAQGQIVDPLKVKFQGFNNAPNVWSGPDRLVQATARIPFTQQPKTTASVPKPGGDFDYKSLFSANAAGTPKLDELKKYNLTLADWNKLQARAMELAREAAEAESDLTGKLRLQVDARVRAWTGESEARKQAFQLATTLVARQKQVDDGAAREARTQAEIRAQEKLEKAIRNASRARLEQLANGTVGENGLTLDKWKAARAEIERRDRAEAESRRKNAA